MEDYAAFQRLVFHKVTEVTQTADCNVMEAYAQVFWTLARKITIDPPAAVTFDSAAVFRVRDILGKCGDVTVFGERLPAALASEFFLWLCPGDAHEYGTALVSRLRGYMSRASDSHVRVPPIFWDDLEVTLGHMIPEVKIPGATLTPDSATLTPESATVCPKFVDTCQRAVKNVVDLVGIRSLDRGMLLKYGVLFKTSASYLERLYTFGPGGTFKYHDLFQVYEILERHAGQRVVLCGELLDEGADAFFRYWTLEVPNADLWTSTRDIVSYRQALWSLVPVDVSKDFLDDIDRRVLRRLMPDEDFAGFSEKKEVSDQLEDILGSMVSLLARLKRGEKLRENEIKKFILRVTSKVVPERVEYQVIDKELLCIPFTELSDPASPLWDRHIVGEILMLLSSFGRRMDLIGTKSKKRDTSFSKIERVIILGHRMKGEKEFELVVSREECHALLAHMECRLSGFGDDYAFTLELARHVLIRHGANNPEVARVLGVYFPAGATPDTWTETGLEYLTKTAAKKLRALDVLRKFFDDPEIVEECYRIMKHRAAGGMDFDIDMI